jgi:competence protein ComEC
MPPDDVGTLLPPHADIEGAIFIGRVSGAVEHTERGARLTLHTDTLIHYADTLALGGAVRVFLRPSPWDTTAIFPDVRQGDRLRLTGDVQAPPSRRNPADFDYGAYLRRRGIHALMNVKNPAHAVITRRPRGPVAQIASVRSHIVTQLGRHVSSAEPRAVLRALLVGDRGRIAEETEDRFAATGLLHLLAISGLHVLLVGMMAYQLIRPMLVRCGFSWQTVEWTRALLTIGLLCGFALLTGGRPSVVRAVIMAVLFIGANGLQRNTRSLNTLGVAALILLVYRPLALFDAGFQLSFAAVGAIVSLNPRLESILPVTWTRGGWRGQVSSLVTVSAAATLGTLPVLLAHFGYVSLAGLTLNVVAIPLTALALLSGLCMVITSGWAVAASLFGAAANLLTRGLLEIAALGEAWLGWAAITKTVRDPLVLAAVVVGLLLVAHWPLPRRRWRLTGTAILLVAVHTWTGAVTVPASRYLDVIFFDAGQGDAALVTFPSGQHLLVDAGPRSPYTDAGASVVVPHLRRYGIDHLDAVLISHADSDHLGGLPSILRDVSVGRIIMNKPLEPTELTHDVDALIDSLAIPRHSVFAGDTLALSPTARVQILGPPPGSVKHLDDNNASLVVRLVHDEHRFLFAGDAEQVAEQWLVDAYDELLRSDVIKVGHHGSITSSTPVFVQEAASEEGMAVISAGRRNPFGFPNRRVVDRWKEAKMDVTTTAEYGAVWVRSEGTELKRLQWQKQ